MRGNRGMVSDVWGMVCVGGDEGEWCGLRCIVSDGWVMVSGGHDEGVW